MFWVGRKTTNKIHVNLLFHSVHEIVYAIEFLTFIYKYAFYFYINNLSVEFSLQQNDVNTW